MAMVVYNSWDILKMVSFTAVGPWNAMRFKESRQKNRIYSPLSHIPKEFSYWLIATISLITVFFHYNYPF